MVRLSGFLVAIGALIAAVVPPVEANQEALASEPAFLKPASAVPALQSAQLRLPPNRIRGIQPKKSGAHDLEFWNAIKESKDAADYEAYLESFPEGSFAPLARLRIRQFSKKTETEATPNKPQFEVIPMEAPFVALANANVRALPNAESEKVAQLSKDGEVEVTGRVVDTDWFRVRADGKTGYVFGTLIASAVASKPAAKPVEQAKAPTPVKAPEPEKLEPEVATPEKKQPGSTTLAALPAGSGNRDCEFCPELVDVAAGSFTLGSNSGNDNERPATKVTIKKPFAIGRHEVSIREWAFCVEDGGCSFKPKKKSGQSDRAPMRNLSWLDAMEYVNWLSKKTGRPYRLPSEAEWEYAARAGSKTSFWWGDNIGKGQVDCKDCGSDWVRKSPRDVGSFDANAFGLFDTSGSVWEWTADCWNKSHDGAPRDGSVRDSSDCRQRVLRGGSWRNEPDYLRSASRFNYDANVRYLVNGFRVAVGAK